MSKFMELKKDCEKIIEDLKSMHPVFEDEDLAVTFNLNEVVFHRDRHRERISFSMADLESLRIWLNQNMANENV